MASALQLLRGEQYAYEPSYQPPSSGFLAPRPEGAPEPMPQATAPESQLIQLPEQPSYAALLAESQGGQPMAMPVADRGMMGGQPRGGQQPALDQDPPWLTAERKALMEKYARGKRNYEAAVAARRKKRAMAKEYTNLYHSMERERARVEDLNNLMKSYPQAFPQDDPRTLSIIKQQMGHLEAAKRIRTDLQQRLHKLGVKVDPQADLPADPFGDEGDDQFDQFAMQGYRDALMTPYAP